MLHRVSATGDLTHFLAVVILFTLIAGTVLFPYCTKIDLAESNDTRGLSADGLHETKGCAMRLRYVVMLVPAALVLALTVLASDRGRQEPERSSSSASSTVYVVYTSQDLGSGGVVLTTITREEFLGIPCLKGVGAEGWIKGTNVRIPVDKITGIIECKSIEEWKEKVDQHTREYGPR